MKYTAHFFMTLALILVMRFPSAAQQTQEESSNAVEQTLALFDSYSVVGIGEFHGLKELGEFYISVIQHPDFPGKVGSVVVEFGNSRYQEVIDRYLNGEDVPEAELQQVWTTTLGFSQGDMPLMYAEFFKAVRVVNLQLPEDQRIRVYLGDLDASDIPQPTSGGGLPPLPDRDGHFAHVLIDNVLSKDEKALVITGALHLVDGPVMGGMMVSVPFGGALPPAAPGNGPVVIQPAPGGQQGQGSEMTAFPPGAATLITLIEAQYPGITATIGVHVGVEEPCNQELETQLAEGGEHPVLVKVADTWLQTLLERPDCRDTVSGQLPGFNNTWMDYYLYLGPRGELTMSPTVEGAEPQSLVEYAETHGANVIVQPGSP